MKKTYELNENSSIIDLLNNIQSDFPNIEITKIVGISIDEKHLTDKRTQLHHFTPIYFGDKIVLPYTFSKENIFPVYIREDASINITRITSLKEVLISNIEDISPLEYELFGFNTLNYNILKNNIPKHSETIPVELKNSHIISAVSLSDIKYINQDEYII